MSRKNRAPSQWKAERLDDVRRALAAPVRPPRAPDQEAEAERTERRQVVRFGARVDQAAAKERLAAMRASGHAPQSPDVEQAAFDATIRAMETEP